jgi:uncharacterized protein
MMTRPDREHRPFRAWFPLRLAAYLAAIAGAAIVATILSRLLIPPAPSPWHQLVWVKNLLLPVALLAVYAGLVRWFERRPAAEISFRTGWHGLAIGTPTGIALIAAAFLLLQSLAMARIAPGAGASGWSIALLIALVTALGEELLFRVILFGQLEKMFGSAVALLASSALFAAAHAGNPGATPVALAALGLDLGLLLALAYMLTRNLWLAVGLHLGWNFAEGFLFGALNSGMREPHHYFETTLTGPDLMTGGLFGPEASLVIVLISLAASAMLFRSVRRRGEWHPVRLRLHAAG